MARLILCNDCRWAWRSCKEKGYPNAQECYEYVSRLTGERYLPPARSSNAPNNADRVDENGKIWRHDRYWDNKKGWINTRRKPSLFTRLVKLLKRD